MLTGWGSNRHEQLGCGSSNVKLEPTPFVDDERFVALAAGEGHSLAVTEAGEVFAFGRNTEGQVN